MKQIFGASLACALLCGCDAHVDLDNIDPSAQLEMGIALPVGEFNIRMGDLLSGDSGQISINEQGVYQFSTSFDFDYSVEDIDMSKYKAHEEMKLKVYDQVIATYLPTLPADFPTPDSVAIPGGSTVEFEFPLQMEVSNLNEPGSDERIDSLDIKRLRLVTNIEQNFGLKASAIQEVELVLSDAFRYDKGKIIDVPFHSFGQDVEVVMDDICVNFLYEPEHAEDDTVDYSTIFLMNIRFRVTLDPLDTVYVKKESAFDLNATAQMDDYNAIYGSFVGQEEFAMDGSISISELWEGYQNLKRLSVSLAEPEMTLKMTTPVATGILFKINSLKAENADRSEYRTAKFGGKESYEVSLPNYVRVTDPFGTTATNTIVLNQENGEIGKLFEIHPEHLTYNLGFQAEMPEGMNQQRLVNGYNNIDIHVDLTTPFSFNQGCTLAYVDTAEVDFSTLDTDSLFKDTEVVDSIAINELHLMLTMYNSLPLSIRGKLRFLNEQQQDLGIGKDGFQVAGPKEKDDKGQPIAGTGYVDIQLNRETVALLKQTRYLVYEIEAEDPNAAPSLYPVRLTPDCGLKLKMALTANVSAYLKLMFNK